MNEYYSNIDVGFLISMRIYATMVVLCCQIDLSKMVLQFFFELIHNDLMAKRFGARRSNRKSFK